MLEEFDWVDDVADQRALLRLGVVSGSVLLVAVVVLVHEHRRGAAGLSGMGLFAVWAVVLVAGLLLLGAVSGLLSRRAAARRPRLDEDERHDRQSARARLLKRDAMPAELVSAAQRVVDETARRRWMPWSLYLALALFWAGTAYLYRGWNLWLHVGAAALYLSTAAVSVRERRRLLASAERLGIRPSTTPRRSRRRFARFHP